jgi:hypothetical protein
MRVHLRAGLHTGSCLSAGAARRHGRTPARTGAPARDEIDFATPQQNCFRGAQLERGVR